MKALREQLTGRCRHLTACRSMGDREKCKADVCYYDLARVDELGDVGCVLRLPCGGEKPGTQIRSQTVEACGKYSPLTEHEIHQRIKEIEEQTQLLMQGLSSCCKAPMAEMDRRNV